MEFTFSSTINKNEIRSISKKVEKELLYNFYDLEMSYGNSIIKTNFLDSLRLVYELVPKNEKEKTYKNFLIKTFVDSEKLIPGSGIVALLAFVYATQKKFVKEELLRDLRKFSGNSIRSSKKDLLNFISEIPESSDLKNIVYTLINEAGFSSSVDISSSKEYKDYFLIEDTSQFMISVDDRFSSMVKKKKFEKSNCNVIVVDGIVEEVSEIHHALTHFSENKNFCFFICRGFSNDAINTLATNFVRGTLRVIPCILNYSIDSINTLKDVSVYCDFDMISTLKGDNISSIDLQNIPNVEYISCDEKFLKIRNEATRKRVMLLSKNLKRQAAKEAVEDKIELLERRILSLNPRKMKIYFSDHEKDTVGIKKDRVKTMISLVNSMCRTGEINLEENNSKNISCDISEYLNKIGFTKFPAGPFFNGIHVGIINADILLNTKNIISLER